MTVPCFLACETGLTVSMCMRQTAASMKQLDQSKTARHTDQTWRNLDMHMWMEPFGLERGRARNVKEEDRRVVDRHVVFASMSC